MKLLAELKRGNVIRMTELCLLGAGILLRQRCARL